MTDDKSKQTAAPAGATKSERKPRKKFLRYEWFKCKKLGLKWRRPVGLHSKVRQGRKGKPPQVNAGFGHAVAERGKINGYVPVVVQNVADLERVDTKKQVAVLASALGMQAAIEMAVKAKQLGVTILNTEKLERAQHRVWMINKQREDKTKAKTETKPEVKAQPATVAKPVAPKQVAAPAKPASADKVQIAGERKAEPVKEQIAAPAKPASAVKIKR